jgi:hypothetical protein
VQSPFSAIREALDRMNHSGPVRYNAAMDEKPNAAVPMTKPRGRWFQFRLRSVLIGVTIVATLCPIGAWLVREWRERRAREADTVAGSRFGPTPSEIDKMRAALAPIEFNREKCESIVQLIDAGKLTEARPGSIDLPPDLRDATKFGTVYLTRRSGMNLYMFEIWRGKSCNFHGYLYSRLSYEQMGLVDDAEVEGLGRGPMVEIVVGSPSPAYPHLLTVHSTIKPTQWKNWYEVAYSLD